MSFLGKGPGEKGEREGGRGRKPKETYAGVLVFCLPRALETGRDMDIASVFQVGRSLFVVYLLVCLFVYLLVCLFVYLFSCLFVYLFNCFVCLLLLFDHFLPFLNYCLMCRFAIWLAMQ